VSLENGIHSRFWGLCSDPHLSSWIFGNDCKQGLPEADATDAAALGPAPLGAPRNGVWVDYSFLPDTPCAWEFSRNAIYIRLLTKNALVRTSKFPLER